MNKQDIKDCLTTLNKGGVILYPTDTIWGIGCDATNADAVDKLYTIKQRDKQKPMIILLDNINRIMSYVDKPPEVALDVIELSNQPLTMVFDNAKNLPENLIGQDGSIAIRVVKNKSIVELVKRFKRPLVSTSANVAGEPPALSFDDIPSKLKTMVDYVCTSHRSDVTQKRSAIIRIKQDGEIIFLRK
ncbi:MAG: L-threonylcarbamoyladenylate synthase [Bacteroidota bacterium]|nr:L-threonylcarbamoyladenylate synthase [Bacteroidota bacterium]